MKQIDCFLPLGDFDITNQIVTHLRQADMVDSIYILMNERNAQKILSTNYLYIENVWSSETIRRIAEHSTNNYTLIYTKADELQLGLYGLQRMIQIADDTSAGMVYTDFYEWKEGVQHVHPVIDYQKGSLRDDFDFGSLLLYRTDILKMAASFYQEDYSFAGLYDLRLKISQWLPLVRINEPLYTVIEKDIRKSGEKLFDYVNPKNREVQIEMEKACTNHLKMIGGFLKPVFKTINFDEDHFETEASVIIPVRNRIRTIADAIQSVLVQKTSFSFNLIIVDNHSTDGTTQEIQRHAAENPKIIHVCPKRTDLGIGGCWNIGIAHPACGKFAIQLDSDDVYSDEHTLQKIVDAFYQQQCGMVVGTYRMTDFNMETIPPGIIDHREWTEANGRNNALRINGLGAPRAFYTPLLRKINLPNTSYGEDYALGLRISREYQIGRIYDVLYLCRRWEDNSDSSLDIVKMNTHNSYKDKIRTWELEARIQINKDFITEIKINSSQANGLLVRQMNDWPLVNKNNRNLRKVSVKTFTFEGYAINVQFNPSRIVSSGAKTDAASIAKRECFLCFGNLPPQQEFLSFGKEYIVLCNPYPIFPQHFTIAARTHTDQSILPRFKDFLELARQLDAFTIFYNGPGSGASAPDHAHFQAVTRYYMPMDKELELFPKRHLLNEGKASLYLLTNYLRNGFIIQSDSMDDAFAIFKKVYKNLPVSTEQAEPMMNIFCRYDRPQWTVVIIPRRKHRPWQYNAEGKDHLLTSPGAADIGGLFITSLEKDFEKISGDVLVDIFEQICFNDEEVTYFAEEIVNNQQK